MVIRFAWSVKNPPRIIRPDTSKFRGPVLSNSDSPDWIAVYSSLKEEHLSCHNDRA